MKPTVYIATAHRDYVTSPATVLVAGSLESAIARVEAWIAMVLEEPVRRVEGAGLAEWKTKHGRVTIQEWEVL